MTMSGSILNDVKKMLGIDESYDAFDLDITININSVLATLTQLGVGPEEGFYIRDGTEVWSDILNDDAKLNNAQMYMYLKVRQVFDPPTSSSLASSITEQIKELEWRINVEREKEIWTHGV